MGDEQTRGTRAAAPATSPCGQTSIDVHDVAAAAPRSSRRGRGSSVGESSVEANRSHSERVERREHRVVRVHEHDVVPRSSSPARPPRRTARPRPSAQPVDERDHASASVEHRGERVARCASHVNSPGATMPRSRSCARAADRRAAARARPRTPRRRPGRRAAPRRRRPRGSTSRATRRPASRTPSPRAPGSRSPRRGSRRRRRPRPGRASTSSLVATRGRGSSTPSAARAPSPAARDDEPSQPAPCAAAASTVSVLSRGSDEPRWNTYGSRSSARPRPEARLEPG